ncbi:hypothetical protein CRG98_043196 [Punica granatum]|uniref:Uncharacterized protein n=1 Tax=Punica granatum TaxID=22663 RepID=A0A2I0HXH8_PUNGR|nr:hypothetical protein CRG98_043196 [Punica granatum]
MKLTRSQKLLVSSKYQPQLRTICGKILPDDEESDAQFVSLLRNIVRGKHSWSSAFNNPFITASLRPHHVEKVLVETLEDSRLALRFFNFLGLHKNFNHSTASFCILIHALVQSNLFWPASSLLQTLLFRDLSPREVFGELLYWYRECGFSLSLGFDLVIQSYVQNGRALDAVLIFKLMTEESDLLPEMRTLSGLLNGLARARQFHKVVELFDHMLNLGLEPDVFAYTAVVRSLAEEFELGVELMNEMLRLGFVPSEAALSGLVEGLRKTGRELDAFDLVIRVGKRGAVPNLFVYNALINSLCRIDKRDDAMSLFKGMEMTGLVPNDVTYTILINFFCKKGELDAAIQFFSDMGKGGIKPTVYSYNSLIYGHCRLRNLLKAESFFRQMTVKGLTPTVVTEGRLMEALRVAQEMVERDVNMDLVCYTVLIDGTLRKNGTKIMFGFLKEMHELGISPDIVLYTSMIDNYSRAGKLKEALGFWDVMVDEGVLPNAMTYTALINGFCKSGSIDKAEVLLKEMLVSGHLPNQGTLLRLLH